MLCVKQSRAVELAVDLGVVVSHHCERSTLVLQVPKEWVHYEVECWENSTCERLCEGRYRRSDKRNLSPTTLGSYNNWFRSLATSPRASAIVLCGQDIWRTLLDHSSVQLHRVLAKGETTSDVDDRCDCQGKTVKRVSVCRLVVRRRNAHVACVKTK